MQSTFTQYGQRSPVSTLPLHQHNELQNQQYQQLQQQHHRISALGSQNGEIILGVQQRHHRDLFSGSLGIPDVSTHVGSVIHAFETIANKREAGEKPYENASSTKSSAKKKSKKLNEQNRAMTMDHDYRKSLFANNVVKSPTRVGTDGNMDAKIFQENLNLNRSATLQHFGHLNNIVSSNNNNNFDSNYNHANGVIHLRDPNIIQVDDEFTRGSTVSQSFIKNVPKYKAPVKRDRNSNSTGRMSKRRNGEVEERFREYGGERSSKKKIYKPRTLDRADL